MVSKILSNQEINVYDFIYRNDTALLSMLSDFEEIAWINRGNGFKEGVIKTTNVKALNLENMHLVISFISEIKSYLEEKSLEFVYPIENLFIKVLPETSYNQQFVNPGLIDTLSILYIVNDGHEGGTVNFLNKDISIPLSKGNLIIFPSLEEYAYILSNITSGEMIVGISYLEVKNV